MGVIMSSVAFLEAAINELFLDANDDHLSYVSELGPDKVRVLKEAWPEIKAEQEIVKKYRRAHGLLRDTELQDLENLFRITGLLVKLRNELTHYKPVTRTVGDRDGLSKWPRILEDELPRLFDSNPLAAGHPFVPDGCLGAGGATWAVETAERFATEFFGSIGLQPNFMRVSFETTDQDS